MQKADHAVQKLYAIIDLFYPRRKKRGWKQFAEFLGETYGPTDRFTETAIFLVPYLMLVRNARDALEHENTAGVIVSDFALLADGSVTPPSIEVDFRDSKHPSTQTSIFMSEMASAIVDAFELVIAHLCDKHVQSFGGLPICVGLIPEERRSTSLVQFSYGTYNGDQFMPIG